VSAPQTEALAAYQRQRSTQRRNSVTAAIARLDHAARPVTVSGVAALAGVDRSYIYNQPDLLEEIRRRRTAEPEKWHAGQPPTARRSHRSKLGWPARTTRSRG
jgi:hypothetical protein